MNHGTCFSCVGYVTLGSIESAGQHSSNGILPLKKPSKRRAGNGKRKEPVLECSETEIQKEVLDYLAQRGILAWKNRNGGSFGGFKKHQTLKGVTDILGLIGAGFILCIEMKKPGGVVSKEQQDFIEHVNRKGGLAFVAYSLDDVIKKIDMWMLVKNPRRGPPPRAGNWITSR